jgi:hypothetical protein
MDNIIKVPYSQIEVLCKENLNAFIKIIGLNDSKFQFENLQNGFVLKRNNNLIKSRFEFTNYDGGKSTRIEYKINEDINEIIQLGKIILYLIVPQLIVYGYYIYYPYSCLIEFLYKLFNSQETTFLKYFYFLIGIAIILFIIIAILMLISLLFKLIEKTLRHNVSRKECKVVYNLYIYFKLK